MDKQDQEQKLIINPNEVSNSTGKAIDYDKLINEFGTKKLTQEQIDRFQKLTGVKEIHPLIKRGVFFSHRDFDKVLDHYEKGKEIYLYTGRGPSTDSMHLGHLISFIICKYLQDAFKCPIVIQLTDDEKYFYQKTKEDLKKSKQKQQDLDWFSEIAIENAKDIIACGYDVSNTFIFRNTDYIQHMYPYIVRLQRHITYNQIKGIFGLNGSENTGKVAFPAIQAVPCMSKIFPHIFKGKEQALCLIPCGIDQDPYFRMTRDIAQKLSFPKPCSFYSKFFPALQGWDKKMSSSDPNSAIFLKDTPNQIKKKINKYAFSGGQPDKETHRKLGANLDVDIAYQYLKFFCEDDQQVEEIGQKYKKGELLSGEVKKTLITLLQKIIKGHQDRRAKITREVVMSFMKVRPF